MKRTKETYFRNSQNPSQMSGFSGLKELEGEDLSYEARIKFNKEQQRRWLEEQLNQKKQVQETERQEEQAYAIQTIQLNRMRGMLEDDFNRRKAAMREAMKQENLKLSKEKQDLQKRLHDEKLQYELNEIHCLQQRGQKRLFPS